MRQKFHRTRTPAGLLSLLCLTVLLLSPVKTGAEGRWVTHMINQAAPAGVVGKPVDVFSLPHTAGHWVWLVWFDYSAGRWDYDDSNPYFYSRGTVEFRVPQFNSWYYLLFYDTVTGLYY